MNQNCWFFSSHNVFDSVCDFLVSHFWHFLYQYWFENIVPVLSNITTPSLFQLLPLKRLSHPIQTVIFHYCIRQTDFNVFKPLNIFFRTYFYTLFFQNENDQLLIEKIRSCNNCYFMSWVLLVYNELEENCIWARLYGSVFL